MIHLVGVAVAMVCSPLTWMLMRCNTTAPLPSLAWIPCVLATCAAAAVVGTWSLTLVPVGVCFCLLAVPAAAVDFVEHRIPNRLSLPLAGATAASLAAASFIAADSANGVRALVGASVWGGHLLLSFVATGQPGPGDVKLAPSMGALLGWFGWPWLLGGLVAAYLLTAVAGLVSVAAGRYRLREGQVPMGPSMVAAVLIMGTLAQL
ncbi:A24 family peptidase [Amycolatopsis sp. NPDC051061]|uniref:A24 family peptidase n=1 Tax=Amycolatopsis sp. NPDC051061 TaxID=3155042 RepID=UPI00343520FE